MMDGIMPGSGLGYGSHGANGGWTSSIWGFLASVTGLSVFSTLLSGGGHTGPLAGASQWKILSVLVFGSLVEIGRRLCLWAFERFRFQYYITAEFHEGDPTYDWIILLLTQEKIWKRTKNFRVTSKTSQRKWSVRVSKPAEEDIADYVPTFGHPQLWRWNGYWVEVTRNSAPSGMFSNNPYGPYGDGGAYNGGSSIYLRIYSLDMSVLSRIVEAARAKYLEVSRPYVIVHALDPQNSYNTEIAWNNVKRKAKRPLDSIILEEGVFEGLIADAKEFIDMEEWYADAGIPHRRGYLLHGPPGTGKSSTIYGLAGELKMEIYSLSLAAHFVDDYVLENAATSIPKNSILLIEDIDCAFPSREELEWMEGPPNPYAPPPVSRRSAVTLSGLLNVLDGVGSEEGKLFFATTNYIDHLDPALLRPGRIDKKIQYKLANSMQAEALFKRFYPSKHSKLWDHIYSEKSTSDEKQGAGDDRIVELARSFADKVPENEFSTAELQGYLLEHKRNPLSAAEDVLRWIENERTQREEKKKREEERKAKAKANRLAGEAGSPMYGLPSPRRDPFEIDVLPPSPAASASPDGCACKASSPPADADGDLRRKEDRVEGQAPATPPAENEDVVVVGLLEGEKT